MSTTVKVVDGEMLVIGGLITATLLTLIVLPVLYSLYERKPRNSSDTVLKNKLPILFLIATLLIPKLHSAQNTTQLDELIDLAIENNAGLKATSFRPFSYKLER